MEVGEHGWVGRCCAAASQAQPGPWAGADPVRGLQAGRDFAACRSGPQLQSLDPRRFPASRTLPPPPQSRTSVSQSAACGPQLALACPNAYAPQGPPPLPTHQAPHLGEPVQRRPQRLTDLQAQRAVDGGKVHEGKQVPRGLGAATEGNKEDTGTVRWVQGGARNVED